MMASAARADAIATMTRDLMRVLADSYSSAGVLNELSRELATVTAYVDLMKVRFGERFELELAIDPDVGSALVLRMILQPIVENSILHGFADAQVGAGAARRGTIRITARCEARDVPVATAPEPLAVPVAGRALVIEVRDNGAGMTADRAAEVVAGRATRGGLSRIGVANVQRRIRLHFGDRFGLAIDSERGAFTRVQFVLPVLIRAAAPAESSRA
jgi:two-component system sensor histidine kinase YesM